MTIPKEEVMELLCQMPDDVEIEDGIYRLYLREKLASAETDVAAGRALSAEEVRKQSTE